MELDHNAGKLFNEFDEKEEKKTQSQTLIDLASDMELFYDEQGVSYAKVKVDDHYEVWPVKSHDFKLILTARYLNNMNEKVPSNQGITEALNALEAKARLQGRKDKVHVRIAETEDSIYIDLCDTKWRVIQINENDWEVIENPPVFFKRSKIMQPLPEPTTTGSIEELKPFLNFEGSDDFKLFIAWLLSTLRENSPFPILSIQGEQGSAKSTNTKVLRTLIDPSSLPLRALPKEERELAIGANGSWILAFDNLSGISNTVSDALCKLSTGGGVATRQLFSDDGEFVFNIKRPAILNGIDDIGKRQDLLDRSIVLNLPAIPEDMRIDEKTFWKHFNKKKGNILGALCTIVSHSLKELPSTKLKKKPRMADFALWITAAEKALNWEKGKFMEVYTSNRKEAIDQGLESDIFASTIIQLLKDKKVFVGNATQLLNEAGKYTDQRTLGSREWPKSKGVRNRLKRLSPALKSKNILYVEWENKMNKTLKLEYSPEKS